MKLLLTVICTALLLMSCTGESSATLGENVNKETDSTNNDSLSDSLMDTIASDSLVSDSTTDTVTASTDDESPVDGIKAIIVLFETQNWDELIRTRYAEIYKASGEDDIQKLISKYESLFSDDASRNEAIATYQSALLVTPVLSENNTIAQFNLPEGFIKLSLMENDQWGFHL